MNRRSSSLPPSFRTPCAVLLLLGTLAGCGDSERIRHLEAENDRLSGELTAAHEEMQTLRFKTRDLGTPRSTAPPPPSDFSPEPQIDPSPRLRQALESCESELQRVRSELKAAQETAQLYREAGERAVEELNRRTQRPPQG